VRCLPLINHMNAATRLLITLNLNHVRVRVTYEAGVKRRPSMICTDCTEYLTYFCGFVNVTVSALRRQDNPQPHISRVWRLTLKTHS
jgi:hypothetical protein